MDEYTASGYVISGLLGVLGGFVFDKYLLNIIPNNTTVGRGFIAPSRLKVTCEDKNGELETILKIDDQKYFLRNVNGVPVLSAYEVKPAEIQYK